MDPLFWHTQHLVRDTDLIGQRVLAQLLLTLHKEEVASLQICKGLASPTSTPGSLQKLSPEECKALHLDQGNHCYQHRLECAETGTAKKDFEGAHG